jgi:hypothetical protein
MWKMKLACILAEHRNETKLASILGEQRNETWPVYWESRETKLGPIYWRSTENKLGLYIGIP